MVVAWTLLSFSPMIRAKHLPRGVHVRITRSGSCRILGGDESASATVTVRHRRTYAVGACLRGPGIAAGEEGVRAMVASAVSVD